MSLCWFLVEFAWSLKISGNELADEPFVLSAIEEALYTPRQLFHSKVQFMNLAPAYKKKRDLIWSFVPAKMTVENDEASVITVAAGRSGLDLGALRKLFHGRRQSKSAAAAPLLQRGHPPLCRWTRLSSSIRNPHRLAPLWGSFVFFPATRLQ